METHVQENNNSTINTKTSLENTNPIQEASQSSTSSSPSHDFSFTISLQPLSSSSLYSRPNPNLRTTAKTTSSSHQTDPLAVDLSPADEIFFHGHLLPLHLLSHLPVSPRTSTGSLDSIALPAKDVSPEKPTLSFNTTTSNNNNSSIATNPSNIINETDKNGVFERENSGKSKPIRSFSLFNPSRWRKGLEMKEREDEEREENEEKTNQQKKKKLVRFDLSHGLIKYIRMLFQRRETGSQFMKRQAYSFSSASTAMVNSRSRNNYSNNNGYKGTNSSKDLRGRRRRGEFSAPASMRTSPTNSGHLRGISTTSSSNSCSTSSDSTMEELQAAIQAAIAHCKNSIAVHDRDDKVNN